MEQPIEIIVNSLKQANDIIIEAMEPKGIISPNLTTVILDGLDNARKNLISNG